MNDLPPLALAFGKGFVMGLCIAAPVGPIGLLCIRRSIVEGRLSGFVTGLGAATADAVYGLVVALGLSALAQTVVSARIGIQSVGGVLLVVLGIVTARSRPRSPAESDGTRIALGRAYATTLVLTLANPATVIAFVAILAGIGVGTTVSGAGAASVLVAGVFLGSTAWWIVLSSAANYVGRRLDPARLHRVNVTSGILIAAFGGWQLVTLWR